MSNDFLDEGEKLIETDKKQTSIPLALLNLQYTSVNVIIPPSSLIKKSNVKLCVASLVSYHSLKVFFHYCYRVMFPCKPCTHITVFLFQSELAWVFLYWQHVVTNFLNTHRMKMEKSLFCDENFENNCTAFLLTRRIRAIITDNVFPQNLVL